jgi:hypothetical protein
VERVVTLGVVVLSLILVLAIPAGASKPVDVEGSIIPVLQWDEAWEVGSRCFAVGETEATFGGDFAGTGLHYFWSVGHGHCTENPGPLQMVETFRQEGVFDGAVLARSGTFVYRCQNVWRPDQMETIKLDCTIRGGTGELSGLHGHFEVHFAVPPPYFVGEVHFDGE